MERTIHIISVVYVDEPCIVAENTSIVVDMQASDSTKPSVVVPNVYITNLGYPTIVVIKDWNVFHLDHCTVIIILDKRIVVESRVKGNADIANLGSDTNIYSIIHIKIELTIGKN
jgi:hypothetical protein